MVSRSPIDVVNPRCCMPSSLPETDCLCRAYLRVQAYRESISIWNQIIDNATRPRRARLAIGAPPARRCRVIAADRHIAREARALGFPLVGCAPLATLPHEQFLATWLAEGRAGEMRYLERRSAERLDPRLAWPWARSMVVLAFPYDPPPPPHGDWRSELRGRVAAYAFGRDYHDRVADLLRQLIERLRERWPAARFRPYVDTGPILEREWAMRSGLGWIGRNTLLLHRHAGSYFFLAELLTDLPLDAVPLPADRCGTCTRCLSACPTGALTDYAMDPRR